MKLKYKKDLFKKKIILDNNNFQVMMEWEKPYMKDLVKNLSPKGDVLEIGFGLGYSASYIQQHNIKSHTIIEDSPEVLKHLKKWSLKQEHKVIIIEGTWQNSLKNLGVFDSIFFDDSPHDDHPDLHNIRIYDFYHQLSLHHVKKGSRLTWYCDKPIYWVCHPLTKWFIKSKKIKIPKNCKYVNSKNKMYMPLVTFKTGLIKDMIKFVIYP